MPLNSIPFKTSHSTNQQDFRNPRLAPDHEFPPEAGENRPRPLPPEVHEDMQPLMSNLQESIDNPPSQESLDQLHSTIETARADGTIATEEREAIAQATLGVFESMGLTSEEIDTLRTQLQNLAENAPFPRESPEGVETEGHDFLLGKMALDLLVGPPMNGPEDTDVLMGGGGSGSLGLGAGSTANYNDPRLRLTGGVDDFGAIANPSLTDDTIPFQGNEAAYGSGNLPNNFPMPGMGLHPLQGQFPGLMALLAGIEMPDLSQRLTE